MKNNNVSESNIKKKMEYQKYTKKDMDDLYINYIESNLKDKKKNNNVSESEMKRRIIISISFPSTIVIISFAILIIQRKVPLIPAILVFILFGFIASNVVRKKYRIYSYAYICGLIVAIIVSVITVISLKVPIVERIWNWPLPKK